MGLSVIDEKELIVELAKQLPGAVALLKGALEQILDGHEVQFTVTFKKKP